MTESTGKWRAIQEEFLATGDAAAAEKSLTQLRDDVVTQAYRAVMYPTFPQGVAIVAGAAYGRGHTFPYSELDIVLLADSPRRSEEAKDRLPEFVRLLWNAGLRPHCSVHTVGECLEAGILALSLLDRRFLDGDRAAFDLLDAKLPAAVAVHREKLRQRLCDAALARHASYGSTPYNAQPDVKESPGGLQDVRLIVHLALVRAGKPELPAAVTRAVATVAAVRCFLHYRAAGDHNTLDFEAQADLEKQQLAISTAEYFRCARVIFNEVRRAIEEPEKTELSLFDNLLEYRSRISNQDFSISRDRLVVRNPSHLADDPSIVLRLLEFIGHYGAPPSPETERRLESVREAFASWCRQPRPIWSSLKITLASAHAALALRTLQSTGLLSAMLPEWSAIEGKVLPQAEYRYTVDEQALRLVEAVLELRGPVSAERQRFAALFSEIDVPALLLFALLFADMEPDAIERARSAAQRLTMPDDSLDRVAFQIAHRSDLSDALSGRDLDDPATVRQLAEGAGTVENLRLLTVATYARIVSQSSSEKIAWRLERLSRAYSITQHELLRELETDRIEQVPRDLPANAGYLKGFPLRYLRAHTAAEIQEHLQLFEQSRPTGVAVKLTPLEGAYRITIVARDKPSLFASFAGAISSFGLDILKAEAFANSSGVILDTFVVSDPKRMLQLNPTEVDRLNDLMQRIALGRTDAQKLLRGRGLLESHKRTGPPNVRFDSDACDTATLVEIETEDRPGLLYTLATVFSTSACNIDVVLVDTKGNRAIDVFYVAHDGRKLPPEMQDRLKEKLMAVC